MNQRWLLFLTSLWVAWILSMGGCSTSELHPPLPPSPPSYTQVPHPHGMDLGDLAVLMTDPGVPKEPDFLKNCDQDFQKLKKVARSKKDLEDGIAELVKQDAVAMHWCFYGKLHQLEAEIKNRQFIDEKQKVVIEAFEFLAPVARGFVKAFRDSRYVRWAVVRYQKLSEWVFYRKLDLTPQGTMELVQPVNPFGLWRDNASQLSVLEKTKTVLENHSRNSRFRQKNPG